MQIAYVVLRNSSGKDVVVHIELRRHADHVHETFNERRYVFRFLHEEVRVREEARFNGKRFSVFPCKRPDYRLVFRTFVTDVTVRVLGHRVVELSTKRSVHVTVVEELAYVVTRKHALKFLKYYVSSGERLASSEQDLVSCVNRQYGIPVAEEGEYFRIQRGNYESLSKRSRLLYRSSVVVCEEHMYVCSDE